MRATQTAAAAGDRAGARLPRRRRVVVAVALAVTTVLAAGLVAGPPAPGEAYDPGNVGPDGLAGLVELLGSMGVDVEVSPDPPSDISTRLFIARDRLRDVERERVAAWVERGGTLVVGGPSTLHGLQLAGGPVADVFGATARAPSCAASALAAVDQVEHAAWEALVVPPDDASGVVCFPLGGEAAWMVAREHGSGTVVALGSSTVFLNANLDRADNAVLAAALLGPSRSHRLVIAPPPAVGEGETGVLELVPAGFWRLLALSCVAVLLAIVWRARRLGRPVAERLPPVLPGAELARSVAGLLQRSGDRDSAAARLRRDARRVAELAVGAPPGTHAPELVSLVVARTRLDRAVAELALLDGPAADDAQLRRVAQAAADARAALRSPTGDGRAAKTTQRDIDMSTGQPNDTSPQRGTDRRTT